MVWESWYWKLRLKTLVTEIETICDQPDASELDISNLEISIFTGFFLIRKLVEAQTKLSYKTANQSAKCKISDKLIKSPVVDVMNRFDTHKLYDLEAFRETNISLKRTCNVFIHSVFLWMVYDTDGYSEDEGVVSGVHITSSYDKEKYIYWMEISEILRIFYSVIKDELKSLDMYRDPETKEMKVKNG